MKIKTFFLKQLPIAGLGAVLALSGCMPQTTRPVAVDHSELIQELPPQAPEPVAPPRQQPEHEPLVTMTAQAAQTPANPPKRPASQPPLTTPPPPVASTAEITTGETAAEEPTIAPSAEPETPTDVWQRIRLGLRLPDRDHSGVAADLTWYAGNAEYLNRVSERARPYLHYIVEELEARDMPLDIALLPIVESAFQPFAYSHGRAAGIWQFIPDTGRRYGLKQNWWYDGRRDVYAATRAALDYLQALNNKFDGDWLLALAAYNSGEGTVRRAVQLNQGRGEPTDFWSLRLPNETRGYVPKLLALTQIVSMPETHGVSLAPIPNAPYFAVVDTASQIDLALAAELAEIDIDALYQLNPGFNRWATDPDGPHHLLLPVEKSAQFATRLQELPPKKRLSWVRHRVGEGETLIHIARNYQTSVEQIREINQIRGTLIRAGDHLLVPVASRAMQTYTLSAAQRSAQIQNTPREGTKVVHTVRSGDTLWDLSRRYQVNVRELAAWNGIATRDTLKLGQQLVVWLSGSAQEQLAAATPASREAITQRIQYKVRNGDSLAAISQRFKVSVEDLIAWNQLDLEHYLQPGQALTLYVDVIEQSSNI